MTKYKILVDHNLCVGCYMCEKICDNFEIIDGKSMPKHTQVAELGCNEEAARKCPVEAIVIKEV